MARGQRGTRAGREETIHAVVDMRRQGGSSASPPLPIHVVVASRQHGLITRAQLIAAGFSGQQIDRRIANGVFHRVHRGVYVLGQPTLPPRGAEQAALLAVGPGATLSHGTAAALHEILPPHDGPVEVTHPPPHRRARRGLNLHRVRSLPSIDTQTRQGLHVTTPTRTLRDLAAAAHADLAKALNEALVRRLVDPRRLTHPVLRSLLQDGPSPTRSKAERRLGALVAAAQLPRPETKVSIAGHELDALWRAQRLAVEIDGFAFHSTRAAFERDRRRDAHLLATAGVSTMRVTWRQLENEPEAVVARLAAALAGRRTVE